MNTSGRTGAGYSTTGTGVGTGPGGAHRGPIRAAEDIVAGATRGAANGATSGPNTATTGYGAGTGAGTGAGMGAGTGAGMTGAAAGVRPSAGQRIVGEAEKLTGHIVGNPTMVARGQEKKTGMPAAVSNTGGVGTTNAVSGPGANTGFATGGRGTY